MSKIRSSGIAAITLLAAAVLMFAKVSFVHAANSDTVDTVIGAAKGASTELSEIQNALKTAQGIADRMQNPDFAARVLEFSKRQDRVGLTELLKKEMPNQMILVGLVRDFTFNIWIFGGGDIFMFCVSTKNECSHPSGAKGAVVFQQMSMMR